MHSMFERQGDLLSKNLSRRKLLWLAPGIGAGALVGCGEGKKEMLVGVDPDLEADENDKAIAKAVSSLNKKGVVRNENEARIWGNASPSGPLFLEKAGVPIQESLTRFLSKMATSQNPYFKNSSAHALDMIQAGKLKVNGATISPSGAYMNTNTVYEHSRNVPVHNLTLFSDPLSSMSEAYIAITFVHEMFHVRTAQQSYTESVQAGMPIDAAVAKIDAKLGEFEGCNGEEAQAFAEECEAYLYERALVPELRTLEHETLAGVYLRDGANASNKAWKEYLAPYSGCRG